MSNIINPFSRLGTQHKAGLDYVIKIITTSSSSSSSGSGTKTDVSVDQIVDATIAYINTVYGGKGTAANPTPTALSPVSDLELSIIIQDAMNGYINAKAGGGLNYASRQEFFIFQLLEGIQQTPSYGIKKYIEAIEGNIVSSGMSSQEQNQLMMATAIGKADFDYWLAMDDAPVTTPSPWKPFVQAMPFNSPTLISYLVAASMESTLFAEKHRSNSTVLEVASTNGANAISALAASIGVVAGVIMEQWIQVPANLPKC